MVAVDVYIIGQDVDQNLFVFAGRNHVLLRLGRVVLRLNLDADLGGGGLGAIAHGVAEVRHGAVEVGRRGVFDELPAIHLDDLGSPRCRRFNADDGQLVAVDVHIIGQDVDQDLFVFAGPDGVFFRLRRVVLRLNFHADGCLSRKLTIADGVREIRNRAIEVGVRREANDLLTVHDQDFSRSVGRLFHVDNGQLVAIGISVIGQNIDVDEAILINADHIFLRLRRLVLWLDLNGDGGAIGVPALILHRIGEGDLTIKAMFGNVNEGAAFREVQLTLLRAFLQAIAEVITLAIGVVQGHVAVDVLAFDNAELVVLGIRGFVLCSLFNGDHRRIGAPLAIIHLVGEAERASGPVIRDEFEHTRGGEHHRAPRGLLQHAVAQLIAIRIAIILGDRTEEGLDLRQTKRVVFRHRRQVHAHGLAVAVHHSTPFLEVVSRVPPGPRSRLNVEASTPIPDAGLPLVPLIDR